MGCTQSKIENEEAVARCKERKQFMKEAVSSRNAFAAAHSAYAMALKNTGAALSDFAHGEVHPSSQSATAVISPGGAAVSASASASVAAIPEPISETLRPPPPPPLSMTPGPPPLMRAATMPEMKGRPGVAAGGGLNGTIIEEDANDEDDIELEDRERLVRKSRSRGGSSRGRKVEDQEAMLSSSSVPAEGRVTQMPEPPYFEYIFPTMENMPGTTLEDTPAPQPPPAAPQTPTAAVEDAEPVVERKSVDERPKRAEGVSEKAELEAEKAAVGMGLGRGIKKGKGTVMGGEKRVVRGTVNLLNIFGELDDHFLKASESALEVSKMLEATRLHYHSNFADNRGHIDHSARVMRVITWNRSFRGIPNADDVKDNLDSEENETHATILDKLLAWEKKLYEEVKTGELMKFEYQRKVANLNRLKKRATNSESLERAKAAVSHLHTRYIVDMQSMDSTVSEINWLRDDQLYPKLVQLVDGMAKMWETMHFHHEHQAEISKALNSLDISQAVKETSEHHHERTIQLLAVVQDWHNQFCQMIDRQKDYIKSLNGWLKLNLIPIESTLKEKVSSPPRIPTPRIQRLLITWHDRLNKLPDEIARTATINFAAVISTIMQQQEEEMKQRDKCEATRRELARKTRQFKDWHHKYTQKRIPDEMNPDASEDNTHKDAVTERQFMVDQVKRRLEEEEEAYQKMCLQVREKSLASLRTRLPELFRATADVAAACCDMYRTLTSVSYRHNPSETS